MPLDPKYAQFMTGGGDRGDKFPFIAKQEIGESFVGVVTFVGDTFEATNKMYVAPVYSADGQIITPEQGKPTVTTMKVNIRLKKITTIGDDGMVTKDVDEDRTKYVNKWGEFKAIAEACAAAEVSDLPVGWTWGLQRVKQTDKSNAHAFKSKLIAPSE